MVTAYRVTLKYPDGTTMFMGTLLAEELVESPAKDKPTAPSQPPPNRQPGDGRPSDASGRADTGERMTDPQRRYLFRLLAAQGVENKKAEQHLKDYFRVARLADIPKASASEYIDQLVKDRKDAAS